MGILPKHLLLGLEAQATELPLNTPAPETFSTKPEVNEPATPLSGAEGAVYGTRWSRAVMFTRALTIGGGTTDVQLNIIGERLLGLPRDPAPGG